MTSGHNPQREPSAQAARSNDRESSAELPPDILADIVAETNAKFAEAQPTDPALKGALLAVAREHAGQPMTLEPAGVALLAAVLKTEFPIFSNRPALLAKVSHKVAESLLADLTARRRLEHLWATLAEEAA
jgi:hypothetical protein